MELRETPFPGEIVKPKLVLIVGHERKAPGASFALGGSEYDYNLEVSKLAQAYARNAYPNIEVDVILRDGIGISGAYAQAVKSNPDACIELHFNAFNKTANGSEVLCTPEEKDKAFSGVIYNGILEVFGLKPRGIRVLPKGARGAGNVYRLPGFANCLVEPFFGDNKGDANVALSRKQQYAEMLIVKTVTYFKGVGLLA